MRPQAATNARGLTLLLMLAAAAEAACREAERRMGELDALVVAREQVLGYQTLRTRISIFRS